MIGIEDNSGNHQAEQHSPDQCGQRACRSTAKPDHVYADDTVTNAVTQGANEKDLLGSEDGEGCPLVSAEGKVADQQCDHPIHHDGENAPSCPCEGTWAGFGKSQPFTGVS